MLSLFSQPKTACLSLRSKTVSVNNVVNHIKTTQDMFVDRHISHTIEDERQMAETISKAGNGKPGMKSACDVANAAVPDKIKLEKDLELSEGVPEAKMLEKLKKMASKNLLFKTFIGMGYNNSNLPSVIARNVLENPQWYTPYTPYQAEISQGRLEAMLNFQTVIVDLTGLPIANCSLLDEATAAAEGMMLAFNSCKRQRKSIFVSDTCHPQVIEVIKTRANTWGINVVVGDQNKFECNDKYFGVVVNYPDTYGKVEDIEPIIKDAHKHKALAIVASDLLALTMLKPPGEMGADIVLGNAGRFGLPPGYGGPSAAFFAVADEHKRIMPGRIIGISKDAANKKALRMALQTREQHIRREKATSNICTASALCGVLSSFYAIYHGPKGLKKIGEGVHSKAILLLHGLKSMGYKVVSDEIFDTVTIQCESASEVERLILKAESKKINLRNAGDRIGISVDETTTMKDIDELFAIFGDSKSNRVSVQKLSEDKIECPAFSPKLIRKSEYLTAEVFNKFHSEHEILRYMNKLQAKDIGLDNHMIPLGSCTMKLNAASEMIPLTWPEFSQLHPFAPQWQALGYVDMMNDFTEILGKITGLPAVSFMPNSGASGEYAGLQVINTALKDRGESDRNIILIPTSAHGTNPASASMSGFQIVLINCDSRGNVDVEDLKQKVQKHGKKIAGMMLTYPSTYGVFEEAVKENIKTVHSCGGLVYMDGANMNAQVGLTSPGEMGADICHLNLHKTFAMPHGGGGPGAGPICVRKELAKYLPKHDVVTSVGSNKSSGAVSEAPYGYASLLPISYMYVKLLGKSGLKKATQTAILNANYMASRLKEYYPVVFTGKDGLVAHEFIIDCRGFKPLGIEAEDIAKRLMDFGFHAPTLSFPVGNTLMVEPTESESKAELDRYVDALIYIRKEIADIESGKLSKTDNPLKNAPHTVEELSATEWKHSYPREQAAYPLPYLKNDKYFPPVKRVDNTWGDMNLTAVTPCKLSE